MSDDKREELLNMYLVSEVGAHVGSTLRDALAEAGFGLFTGEEVGAIAEQAGNAAESRARADQRTKDAEIVNAEISYTLGPAKVAARMALRRALVAICHASSEADE